MTRKFIVVLNDEVLGVRDKELFTRREIVFMLESKGIEELELEDHNGEVIKYSVRDGVNFLIDCDCDMTCHTARLLDESGLLSSISIYEPPEVIRQRIHDPVSNGRRFVVVIGGQTQFDEMGKNIMDYNGVCSMFRGTEWELDCGIKFNTLTEGVDYLLGNGAVNCYSENLIEKYAPGNEYVLVCVDELTD